MTFFEPIPPIEERALSMHAMEAMLNALAGKHEALHKTVNGDNIWRAVNMTVHNKDAHLAAAREAGFLRETIAGGNIHQQYSLTPKGYAAINRSQPFWQVAA